MHKSCSNTDGRYGYQMLEYRLSVVERHKNMCKTCYAQEKSQAIENHRFGLSFQKALEGYRCVVIQLSLFLVSDGQISE